ncbi:MAG: hypothetical protein FJ029_09970, partial [Actinobacteria bacterium]|nr:hypothetical protein [Actinomycetota bacterium]
TARAWRDFARRPPDAIIASGGYLSGPVVLAGWARRVPIVLFAGDYALALGTRVMAPLVNVLTTSFEESRRQVLGPRVELTGYPLRAAFLSADPDVGRRQLEIAEHDRLLLVMGGSQGAHAINEAVRGGLRRLVRAAVVVHMAGRAELPAMTAARDQLPRDERARYRPFGFVQEGFASLLAAADLVVCRAGATTVAELGAVGVPAVIVPFRFGRAHQVQTARAVEAAGAAVVVEEHELPSGRLIDASIEMLTNGERLARMRAASAARGRPDAAGAVARIAIDLATARTGRTR